MAGWAAYNSEQLGERQDPVTWVGYLGEADFWNRSFQNWQSEMLAVGSMAVFSVFLRQRGSPESKPVGVAHDGDGPDRLSSASAAEGEDGEVVDAVARAVQVVLDGGCAPRRPLRRP